MKKLSFVFSILALTFATQALANQDALSPESREAYRRTKALCSTAASGGLLAQTGSVTGTALKTYWNGIRSIDENPFVTSQRTKSLFEQPGYWEALYECFGDSETMHLSFSLAIVFIDRAGTFTDYVLIGWALKAFGGLVAGTRFILTHPRVAKALLYSFYGFSGMMLAAQVYGGGKEIAKYRRMEQSLRTLAADPNGAVRTEVDEVVEMVRERISEIEDELKSTKDAQRMEHLIKSKLRLEQLLARAPGRK